MHVLATFQNLDQALSSAGFSEEDKTLIALPTPEQVQLLMSTASHPDIK